MPHRRRGLSLESNAPETIYQFKALDDAPGARSRLNFTPLR